MNETSKLYFLVNWLVDGYNVILADPILSKHFRNNQEAGRIEFVRQIGISEKLRRQRTVIVFDGKYSGSTDRLSPHVEVRFSAGRETADDLIKRLIGETRRRSSLTVVSNDRSIIEYAKICGAATMRFTL